ncbi:MAG TPA: DUF5666 domain-containing protein [Terriglobia bacterium]|nr:DUF5666 domain-containing protein [Terriglobia bacterium]
MAALFKEARGLHFAALATLLLLGLALPGRPLYASGFQGQNPPPQNISFSVNGTITESSPGKLTVDSGQDMLFTVKYDSTTQIQHDDGSPAKASELQVGVKILAKGDLTEAGDVIAKQITLEPRSKGPSN